jgi:hypothetical protein
MVRIEDAVEAENMVRSYYSNPVGHHPYGFETHKQVNTWIVVFNIRSPANNVEEHEWHIDSETGCVLSKR